MTAATMFLLFGGGLLLIAILGGGFEIREVKIPKVEKGPRILSAVVGVLSLIVGLIAGVEDTPNEPPYEQPKRLISHRIQFSIFDELTNEWITEQFKIKIDGHPVGTLSTNKEYPKSEFVVKVDNEGQHSLVVQATAINNQRLKLNCYRTGMIDVAEGMRFTVGAEYQANGPCLAWMEQE
jgi:hypothetical protein